MTTTGTLPQGTRTSLTTTAMNSLASATYVSCGTLTHTTNDPLDCLIEVKVTPGTFFAPESSTSVDPIADSDALIRHCAVTG